MKKILVILISLICLFSSLKAQNIQLKSNDSGLLSLNVPVQVFFKNNEYKRKIAYGYTLGGVRTIPNLEYRPLGNLSLSAGINMLRYWGANEYGQYNFINVPYYTEVNTQKQLHLKPYFRFNFQINTHLNLVMGNLYTENFHYLPVPLYNRELSYSSDGEEGLQLIYSGKYWTNDTWLNWQNFNFYDDVDRESFDLGVSGHINTPQDSKNIAYLNYSFIWHHNGGELDTVTTLELDHWANGRIGGAYVLNLASQNSRQLKFSLDYLFSKDMKNSTLPFKSGHAWFPALSYKDNKCNATLGYYDSKDMVSFYGTAFFSNLAQRNKEITYPHNQMLYASFDYDITIGNDSKISHTKYNLSIVGEFFYKLDGENSIEKETKGLSFGLGVIFSTKPSFNLYKFKNLN